MKIFLIGYMGSGKTTIGRPLARSLGVPFVDMDSYISDKYGKSIADIFTTFGEDKFREAERDALRELLERGDEAVISVGGGTPCFFDNMQIMNDNGTTVYLNVSPEGLAARLKHGMEKRPLLRGKSDAELLAFIKKSLAERERFYSQATVNVLCDGYSDVALTEKIASVVSKYIK